MLGTSEKQNQGPGCGKTLVKTHLGYKKGPVTGKDTEQAKGCWQDLGYVVV